MRFYSCSLRKSQFSLPMQRPMCLRWRWMCSELLRRLRIISTRLCQRFSRNWPGHPLSTVTLAYSSVIMIKETIMDGRIQHRISLSSSGFFNFFFLLLFVALNGTQFIVISSIKRLTQRRKHTKCAQDARWLISAHDCGGHWTDFIWIGVMDDSFRLVIKAYTNNLCDFAILALSTYVWVIATLQNFPRHNGKKPNARGKK